jgi:hypothetical protein
MKMLNTKYKVIWRYANPDKFLFIRGENVFPRFQQFCIASNSKGEILYLLSLLNSKITNLLIDRLLKSENEKDVLLGITAIKEFVRVPKIIEDNECVKDEIINRAEEMLSLEKVRLSDLVDFSGIILQKFDGVKVEGRRLVVLKGQKETRLAIKGGASPRGIRARNWNLKVGEYAFRS